MTQGHFRPTPISADARYDRDWLAVAAAGVGMIFSVGTLTLYPFGVFMGPVGHDLGWTRGQMSGAVTFSQVFLVIGSLCWGALLDRFGPRRTLLPAVVGLGLGLALLGVLTRPLWHLYAMFALIPLVAAAANPLGYAGVLVRRFNHNLGLALGLALMGVGLGAALIPLAAQHLIARFGWRMAYAVSAHLRDLFPAGYGRHRSSDTLRSYVDRSRLFTSHSSAVCRSHRNSDPGKPRTDRVALGPLPRAVPCRNHSAAVFRSMSSTCVWPHARMELCCSHTPRFCWRRRGGFHHIPGPEILRSGRLRASLWNSLCCLCHWAGNPPHWL